jgi:hypothetical protein
MNKDKWWEERTNRYYDVREITKEVVNIKRERADKLPLNKESYDFVVFVGNYSL